MANILQKVFLHIIDYDDAPEFAILADGTVQINGEEQKDETKIVEALRANAKAWGKCVDKTNAVDPAQTIAAQAKNLEANLVRTFTGVAVRGPWPLPPLKTNQ